MAIGVIERKAYTTSEAAEALGISENTLGRWLKQGRIRYVQPIRKILIPLVEIDAFLEKEGK